MAPVAHWGRFPVLSEREVRRLVEPLPHQVTAVYESMLPRQPLCSLLGDDPGAGTTIMAGPKLEARISALPPVAPDGLLVVPTGLVEYLEGDSQRVYYLRRSFEASGMADELNGAGVNFLFADLLARAEDPR